MTSAELEKLVAKGEGETLEWKETTGQRGDACETLCAFLNRDGGTVVFGVSRKGRLTGQLISDKTKRELFEAFEKFEPSADVETEWVEIGDKVENLDRDLDRGDPDLIQIDPDSFTQKLLQTIRRNPLISRKLLAVELNASERKIRESLKNLKDSGFIIRQGPDHGGIWRVSRIVKAETEVPAPNSRHPQQTSPNSRPPTVKSPNSQSRNRGGTVERGLLRVLMALDVERGSSDLLILLGLRNRTDLYSRFLLPAKNQGLIEYTIPDKPNSRLQKYRLTPKGKVALKVASSAN